ncbi:MAG TPA: hypothetical protein VL405_03190 [Sphingomonas sp.]|nr:hypothetical protein [Sphingomonas sp.]
MDRILFGDNQFFGVNHASEEKAKQQQMRFQRIEAIADTLHAAYDAGIRGFSCTTHDRIAELANIVRSEPGRWDGLKWYPGMPYAHKYANAVTEHGYFEALKRLLPSGGLIDAMLTGGKAILRGEVEKMATLLIDAEMKPFQGLETPVIFMQNIVTDLILGLGYADAFRIFSDHVRDKYKAEAGFFSMNLPALLPVLTKAGIENPIVCCNVNHAAFRMSGGIEGYREATARTPTRVIAMSVLASGALPAREAIRWALNEPYVEAVLFGASSAANIKSTVSLIEEYRPARWI